jgi:hypothetical protein
MQTKRELSFSRPYSSVPTSISTITVRAGAPVEFIKKRYWIKPNYFGKNLMLKHDATYYGFEVQKEDVTS